MRRGKGGLRRKGITSLSIITTPVIVLATTLCVLVLQQEVPSLFGYVASGSSFFFPSIPIVNLLGFLPDDFPALPFTIGNLVDVIIDVYIVQTIGIIPYRCHKSAREPGIAFNDLQLAILVDPSNIRVKSCASRSGLAQGNAMKQGIAAFNPGRAQKMERGEDSTTPQHGSHVRANRAERVMHPWNAHAHARGCPVDPIPISARKISPTSIAASKVASFSVSASYSRSRARLHGARESYCYFSSKSRVSVKIFSNVINRGMEK